MAGRKLARIVLAEGWEFAQAGTDDWLPAVVPGHVHVDLVRNGLIADPFIGTNERDCQWVDEADWTYRTTFVWRPETSPPPNPPPQRQATLRSGARTVIRFEGLDTVCSVWLNGERIAEHDNMFVPLEVDVTDRLLEGGNELRVEFVSAARVGRERRSAYLAKHGLPDDVPNFDERAFVRKAQCMFGWDWGPRLVSCGIWKPVELIEFDSRIKWSGASLEVIDGRGRFHIESELDDADSILWHEIQDENGKLVNSFWDDASFWESNPQFWDLNSPKFYHLSSFLFDDYEPGETPPLFERRLRIGINSVKLKETTWHEGSTFEFESNECPIYALGANWIPDHALPSQATSERVRERVRQAKDMGCNMLRVWGGGIYESDAFYAACDEFGIFVWQDFMFACSYYPDDPAWLDAIRVEAEFQVKRLRHHPCIALWCGGNECHQVWEDGWGGKDRQPPRFHGEAIYHEVLKEVVERLDPGRSYVPNSPWGGAYCNSGEAGDQHLWDVWHGRGDWVHYRDSDARFCSEFGFASSPSLETWAAAGIEPSAGIESESVRWHNKTGKPFETFRGLVELHYPLRAPSPRMARVAGRGLGVGNTLSDWIEASQLNQRDALRAAIEHFRFSGTCRGALLWQLNDCWPVESWSVLEFGGKPKLAVEEVKRLFAPLLLKIEVTGDRATLLGCLHNATEGVQGEAVLVGFDSASDETLCSAFLTANLDPDEIKELVALSLAGVDPASVRWEGSFAGAECELERGGSD